MPTKKKVIANFMVKVQMPDGCTTPQMLEYIRVALRQWRKGGDPTSVLFSMKDNDFSVR